MAARERYKVDITCTNCAAKGVMHISEDDHLYMRELRRKVDAVEGEFQAEVSKGEDVSITCKACQSVFNWS